MIPYAKNARTHSDAQIAQIAGSIREFGWTNPVLVDGDNGIIAGHGRVLAARLLNEQQVPVIELSGLTDTQRRAYILADNKLALNAGWDDALLALELSDLQGMGVDLGMLGFGEDEVMSLTSTSTEGLTDPDAVPDTPVNPATVAGDVWILGKHRIICGDSTDASIVERALNGVKPNLMVTDPPYGVEYAAAWRDAALGGKQGGRATGAVKNDARDDWTEAWTLFPGEIVYVWHGEKQLVGIAEQLEAAGFERRNLIVWGKGSLVISRGHYHSQHETCWYAVRKGGRGNWHGGRKQSTLWDIPKPQKSETGHSTQRPVECMQRPIENNSSPGQSVYEPFSGSGTTIIACERTGRCCHAIELHPAYVDVAVKRWQDFTGQVATLEGDGRSFAEIMEARVGAK